MCVISHLGQFSEELEIPILLSFSLGGLGASTPSRIVFKPPFTEE